MRFLLTGPSGIGHEVTSVVSSRVQSCTGYWILVAKMMLSLSWFSAVQVLQEYKSARVARFIWQFIVVQVVQKYKRARVASDA